MTVIRASPCPAAGGCSAARRPRRSASSASRPRCSRWSRTWASTTRRSAKPAPCALPRCPMLHPDPPLADNQAWHITPSVHYAHPSPGVASQGRPASVSEHGLPVPGVALFQGPPCCCSRRWARRGCTCRRRTRTTPGEAALFRSFQCMRACSSLCTAFFDAFPAAAPALLPSQAGGVVGDAGDFAYLLGRGAPGSLQQQQQLPPPPQQQEGGQQQLDPAAGAHAQAWPRAGPK